MENIRDATFLLFIFTVLRVVVGSFASRVAKDGRRDSGEHIERAADPFSRRARRSAKEGKSPFTPKHSK